MFKYLFAVTVYFSLCLPALAQETDGAKYVLNGNDIFKQSFFTQSNIGLLYSNLGIASLIRFTDAPSTPTSPGIAGQVAYQNNFLYICVENGNWRRTRLGTW
jgi:hypothetical protein